MKPVSRREATLNDLIDRVLIKGLMLHSDVVVTVSGIPLLGLNLRLALAGMSTMLRYGFMTDWDEVIRSSVQKERAVEGPRLEEGERVLLSRFGSCWFGRGIYSAWQPGLIYLTDRRLLLHRQEPEETLLDISLGLVSGIDTRQEPHFSGRERKEILLTLVSGGEVRLHSADCGQLLAALEKVCIPAVQKSKELPEPGNHEKIWFLAPDRTGKYAWVPGEFSVKEGSLCWRGHTGPGASLRVAAADVLAVRFIDGETMSGPDGGPVIEVRYLGRLSPESFYFSGLVEVLQPWVSLLREARRDVLETCPSCGSPAPANRLINKGCAACGWVSARFKRRLP
ncbi:MAG: Gas vesicle protein [Pelotomaculum sp. PtaU1.Bin035]|nr:MAG: Gas vesicle protein [Pelotomaculum sp. PtaU1.Bin035]